MTLRLGTLQNVLNLGNSSFGALRTLNIGGLRMLQLQRQSILLGLATLKTKPVGTLDDLAKWLSEP